MTALLIVWLVFANRFSGGGFGWGKLSADHGGPLRGRPIYYVGLLTYPVCVWLLGFHPVDAALIALSFVLYRIVGWFGAEDVGTVEGSPLREAGIMAARGLLFFPVFILHGAPALLALLSVTHGAVYYAAQRIESDIPNLDRTAVAEIVVGILWACGVLLVV